MTNLILRQRQGAAAASLATFLAIADRGRIGAKGNASLGVESPSIPYMVVKTPLAADITVYVRPNGLDTNDGSANTAAKAFLTVQAAYDYIVRNFDLNGYKAKIKLADGTYAVTGAYLIDTFGKRSSGSIVIEGNTTTKANVILQSDQGIVRNSGRGGLVYLHGVKLKAGSGYASVLSTTGAETYINNADYAFATGQTDVLRAEKGGMLGLYDPFGSDTGGSAAAPVTGTPTITSILAADGGQIHGAGTLTVTGTFTVTAVARVTHGGLIVAPTFAGSPTVTGKPYDAALCGVIDTGDQTLPGDGEVSKTTGAQYV